MMRKSQKYELKVNSWDKSIDKSWNYYILRDNYEVKNYEIKKSKLWNTKSKLWDKKSKLWDTKIG